MTPHHSLQARSVLIHPWSGRSRSGTGSERCAICVWSFIQPLTRPVAVQLDLSLPVYATVDRPHFKGVLL